MQRHKKQISSYYQRMQPVKPVQPMQSSPSSSQSMRSSSQPIPIQPMTTKASSSSSSSSSSSPLPQLLPQPLPPPQVLLKQFHWSEKDDNTLLKKQNNEMYSGMNRTWPNTLFQIHLPESEQWNFSNAAKERIQGLKECEMFRQQR